MSCAWDDRTRAELAEAARAVAGSPIGVCHGDPSLTNVIVDGDHAEWVDFEIAHRGPVLSDAAYLRVGFAHTTGDVVLNETERDAAIGAYIGALDPATADRVEDGVVAATAKMAGGWGRHSDPGSHRRGRTCLGSRREAQERGLLRDARKRTRPRPQVSGDR